MIKEHYEALRSAGAEEDKAIAATDALVKVVHEGIVRQSVTQWAVLAILGLAIAIAIRVFTA